MAFKTFVPRRARVTVTVVRPNAQGVLTAGSLTFQENRMRISVRQGGAQFGNARIEVYGVRPKIMNIMSRLWLEAMTPQLNDTLAIEVWDGHDFIPFFEGTMTWSAVDASAMPQVKLVMEANAAMALMNRSASPYSNAGPVLLQDALRTIAGDARFAVDYSATAPQYQLTDVRVTGSPMEQIAGIMRYFPDLTYFVNLQRLVVRKINAPYAADPVRIAVDTGLMAPPVYSTSGLQLNTIFNPRLRPGVALDVQTLFDFVNRTQWVAAVLAHQIDVNVPGGQWTTSVAANSFGPKGNNE